MMISLCEKTGSSVITVEEPRVEISNVRKFQKDVEECLKGKPEKVILVMKNVKYIDSSAIGALIALSKDVKSYGGSLQISQVSTGVMDIIRIAQIEDCFDFVV